MFLVFFIDMQILCNIDYNALHKFLCFKVMPENAEYSTKLHRRHYLHCTTLLHQVFVDFVFTPAQVVEQGLGGLAELVLAGRGALLLALTVLVPALLAREFGLTDDHGFFGVRRDVAVGEVGGAAHGAAVGVVVAGGVEGVEAAVQQTGLATGVKPSRRSPNWGR